MKMEMCKDTKTILNRMTDIIEKSYSGEENNKDNDWIALDFPFEFAKALYKEVPYIEKIAKMICVMDDSLDIKVEVK